VTLVYLAALVAGLGTLVVQVALGARGGGHHDGSGLGHVQIGHGGHGHHADHPAKPATSASGFFAIFLSFRFWIFALLGFGLSGSVLGLAGSVPEGVATAIAGAVGLVSGLGAALAFRAAASSSVATPNETSRAVGGIARVVVPLGPREHGKIRIEIAGSSVDLLATTDEEALAKDELVLVEEVQNGIARVSKRPRELE
jgi:membrane protein implicated in regulation of membrane protease activity